MRPGQALCPRATTLLQPQGSPPSADTATKGASGRGRTTAGSGTRSDPRPAQCQAPPRPLLCPGGDAGTAGRKHPEARGHPRGCAYLVGVLGCCRQPREERQHGAEADTAPTEAPQRPAGPRCPPRPYGWAAPGGGAGRVLPGTERCAAAALAGEAAACARRSARRRVGVAKKCYRWTWAHKRVLRSLFPASFAAASDLQLGRMCSNESARYREQIYLRALNKTGKGRRLV
ncbi:hypothetical protein RLOC_00008197 [Lonchura striata]|uniref:Uncharacterized protein n=1 Tax=Lonchura striata TaxID=40157 RepID=A0A218UEG5_9PASE|nr:hypothetical protein RLOC_00008197 [Lonchura striata domestica]